MALEQPTQQQIVDRMRTDVQTILPETNPTLPNSFLDAMITAMAGRFNDNYSFVNSAIFELFPDTATGDFLIRWAQGIYGIDRNAATASNGEITVNGTAGTNIPATTILTSSDSIEYTVDTAVDIQAAVISATSITRSGNTATVTTPSNHRLASNISVTISGAVETAYNITATITVTSETTFTYTVAGSPSTPATGTISVNADVAFVDVTASSTGEDTNQDSGAPLTFSSPIAGVNATAYVQYSTLAGGADLESEEDYRERLLFRIQNPVSFFNVAAIEDQAKTVAGVTRVWVEEITPGVGQVTVYFTRDNDASNIPTAQDVTNVKNALLEIKPANMADADLIVSAPTPVTVNFTFTSITPDTSTMRTAIEDNLDVLFREEVSVGEDLKEFQYTSKVYTTIDPETGVQISDFTISAPSGDVSISDGELPVLGTINF